MYKSIHNPLAKEIWYGRKSIESKRNVSGTAQQCAFFPYMAVYKNQDINSSRGFRITKQARANTGLIYIIAEKQSAGIHQIQTIRFHQAR